MERPWWLVLQRANRGQERAWPAGDLVKGTDKAVYRKVSKDKCGEEWSKWQCLGGKFSTPPEAVLNSEGYIHVFARGIDRAVWHLAQLKKDANNVTWSDWTSMGGIVTSSPAI